MSDLILIDKQGRRYHEGDDVRYYDWNHEQEYTAQIELYSLVDHFVSGMGWQYYHVLHLNDGTVLWGDNLSRVASFEDVLEIMPPKA